MFARRGQGAFMDAELRDRGVAAGDEAEVLPLVVDMDGTLLRTDTLYESFIAVIFSRPVDAFAASASLFTGGVAAYKRRLADLTDLDCETLPLRETLVEYLRAEVGAAGPSIWPRRPTAPSRRPSPRDWNSSPRSTPAKTAIT